MYKVLIFFFLLLCNRLTAQNCSTCTTGTITINAGETKGGNITIGNGQSYCLVGPSVGSGTYTGTITFAGTWPASNSYLCISGNLTLTGAIIANANSAHSKPNITFAENSNITHSNKVLILPGSGNLATINNYGNYTNTNNTSYSTPSNAIITLYGTNFTNHLTGSFKVTGSCGQPVSSTNCYGISINDGGVNTSFTNNGILEVPNSAFLYSSNSTSQSVTNNGDMKVECYTTIGTNGSTINNGNFELTGINGQCPNNGGNCTGNVPFCKDQGSFTGDINSTIRVPNGTAKFVGGTTSNICGKMYVKNVEMTSHTFGGACCLSIQVKELMTISSGVNFNKLVSIWDLTASEWGGPDRGDRYGGQPINCNQAANAGKCWSGWRPTNVYYSATDFHPVGCLALPIELIDFSLKNTSDGNLLQWSGLFDKIASIQVERSIDGIEYEVIGEVIPQNNSIEYFELLDTGLEFPTKIYRLKFNNYQGEFKYSSVIIDTQKGNNYFRIVPLPIEGDYFILETNISEYNYEIVNLLGDVLKTGDGQGYQKIDIQDLSNGIYLVNLNSIEGSKILKFIISK